MWVGYDTTSNTVRSSATAYLIASRTARMRCEWTLNCCQVACDICSQNYVRSGRAGVTIGVHRGSHVLARQNVPCERPVIPSEVSKDEICGCVVTNTSNKADVLRMEGKRAAFAGANGHLQVAVMCVQREMPALDWCSVCQGGRW